MQIVESITTRQQRSTRIALSRTQREAAERVLLGLERGDLVVLRDQASDGKTTVLEHVQREIGGSMIGIRDLWAKLAARDPWDIEAAFLDLVESAFDGHELIIVDDLHRVKNVAEGCNYPRQNLFDAALGALFSLARREGKRLLFATDDAPECLETRAHTFDIGDFAAADYETICSAYLDPAISRRLDFIEIHRFAPSLNAHQLRKAAVWLSHEIGSDTPRFLEYLTTHNLVSNVDVQEVEPVDWKDLKGVEDVIEALEAKIALPFENRELAAEWHLKPKRGVLLSGPPGTGKTTIGRALAHRLKSKFFLIDGTMIAGSRNFYSEVHRIFEAAKRNAPSIVFIDDADVIFHGDDGDRGLYRYLLTMLDGLEGSRNGRVCVMMTAMEPNDLPAAILRSGRVELWLETRLPDEEARAEILRNKLSALPDPIGSAGIAGLAAGSRGLTGADLKAVVEDAKLLFAHDRTKGKTKPPEEYFLAAIKTIRTNRRRYARRKPAGEAASATIGFQPGTSC
jgi:transitional endoplasmic reticulum ATPase